jgi:hypothetical protein
MQAKVKETYRYKTLVAFGLEFIKSEARQVPEENETEAQRHPALEILSEVAPIPEPERKVQNEPKRPRK